MEFIPIILVLAATAAIAALLLYSQKPSKRKNAKLIDNALTHLLRRPYGAYVIIEEPATGKYIQFSGSVSEPLFFDLPRQTLNLDEFEKARDLFAEMGYPGPETFAVYDSMGGQARELQTSFTLSFGQDVVNARKLAIAVLHQVFGCKVGVDLLLVEK